MQAAALLQPKWENLRCSLGWVELSSSLKDWALSWGYLWPGSEWAGAADWAVCKHFVIARHGSTTLPQSRSSSIHYSILWFSTWAREILCCSFCDVCFSYFQPFSGEFGVNFSSLDFKNLVEDWALKGFWYILLQKDKYRRNLHGLSPSLLLEGKLNSQLTQSISLRHRYCQCYPESSCGSVQNLLPIHQQNTGLLI